MSPFTATERTTLRAFAAAGETARCTILRTTGRGAATTDVTVATGVPYRRSNPAAVQLAAMAGGLQGTDKETLYVQDVRVQVKDLLVDAADATLRFFVEGVGDTSADIVRTVYASRQVGP